MRWSGMNQTSASTTNTACAIGDENRAAQIATIYEAGDSLPTEVRQACSL